MRVLIIEDEMPGSERLRRQLAEVDPGITVAGITESIAASVEWLRGNPAPDLVLMDIELADGQSFEIFRQVELRSPVIFTTSYDEYALRAFKVNSIDYLLKPVRKDELKRALSKLESLRGRALPQGIDIEELITRLQPAIPRQYRERFLVKQGQRLLPLESNAIAYFFADGRLSYIRTWSGERYVVEYTLDELTAMMDPAQFSRINRGFVVHIRAIAQIHTYFNGKLKLALQPATGKEVLVSREQATAFKLWMGK